MKKIRFALLILLAFIFCVPLTANASGYVDITEGCEVKILKIVDRETLLAEIVESKETAYIKMVGVSAIGSDTAISFLTRELLGKTVFVLPDPYIRPSGRWSYVYIYHDDEMFNNKILVQGHAKLDTEHWAAAFYNVLSGESTRAELEQLGMWAALESGVEDFTFLGKRININTVNAEQLTGLEGIDRVLAERIISYRLSHPFQTVGELKFVHGFTKELYDAHHNKLFVSTNVNDAPKNELETLSGFTDSDAAWILDYRVRNQINDLSILLSYINSVKYDINKPFMDTKQVNTLYYAVPNYIVNVNTADITQLMSIGIDYYQAVQIFSARSAGFSGYTLKTIGELSYLPGLNYSLDQINTIADNLTLMTEINAAGYVELMSLNPAGDSIIDALGIIENRPFSSLSDFVKYVNDDRFDEIRKYLYIKDETVKGRININTATKEQMQAVGFNEDECSILLRFHKRMKSAQDIPLSLGDYDALVSLYTNVNKALYNEIISLNDGITPSLATAIISYRDNQPIGSMEELRHIFINHNAGHVYDYVKDYIVLR